MAASIPPQITSDSDISVTHPDEFSGDGPDDQPEDDGQGQRFSPLRVA